MKVVLYARVSTDKQECENQLTLLRAFAEKSGYEVHKEYSDVISGKEDSRPAYDLMFTDAHKRLFDVVLFWDLSRFSRSGTLYTLQRLKELENLGIKWISYNEQYFRSIGPFRDTILSILATLAKIEREDRSKATKAGLERRRRQGVILGRPKGSTDKRKRNRRWKKRPQ